MRFDPLEVNALAECLRHLHKRIARLFKHRELAPKIEPLQQPRTKLDPLRNFFDRLWDTIQTERECLNILAFERGHKAGRKRITDFVKKAVFLGARKDELVERSD